MTSTPPVGGGSPRRSLVQLIGELPRILSDLVHAEIASLQDEMKAKAKAAGLGAGLIAAAAFVLVFALGVFITAGIAGLSQVLPLWASALIVGGALVLIAAVLVLFGALSLKRGMPPTPEKTIASVQADIRTIKGIGKG